MRLTLVMCKIMNTSQPYLTIPDNNGPKVIRPLTDIEYAEIITDINTIYEYLYYQRKLKEIEGNKNVYFKQKEYYKKLSIESTTVQADFNLQEVAFVEMNRCFVNFIASFKSFVEHCENKVKTNYGKESKNLLKFKSFESGLYDNHFSYRLLKRLRDYGIHAAYPIGRVTFDEIVYEKRTHQHFSVLFSKDELLSNTTLRKKLGTDLKLKKDFFEVCCCVEEVYPLIKLVLANFIGIVFPELNGAATRLLELSKTTEHDFLSLTKKSLVGDKIAYKSMMIPLRLAYDLKNLMAFESKI